jgi:thiol:disulfide interchange protein
MILLRLTEKVLLAMACCLALVLVPVSVGAQTPGGIIKKGAEGAKKGVETGAEKTKEGAEAVGEGVKKTITGDDTDKNRQKSTDTGSSTEPSQTTTSDSTSQSTDTEQAQKGSKKLPTTAGELPLLALVGGLGLAASGLLRFIHRAS